MASPMRKKRAWSTREEDAESQETAAFEASVAAAKDTAAKSGAFLSTAKSDLTDHKRWLEAQSVAVERDRQRHERWLERQREHRLALARKERARRRRQLMRQRAFRAIQAAVWASLLFVRSLILLAAAKLGEGFRAVARLVAQGLTYLGAKFGALARWTGAGVAAGAAFGAAKAGVLSRSAGRSLHTGISAASARGSTLAGATGRSASRGFALFAEKVAVALAAGKRGLATGYRWSAARLAVLAPALYVRIAKLGRQAERYARAKAASVEGAGNREGAAPVANGVAETQAVEVYGPFYEGFWVEGVSPNEPRALAPAPDAARAETENALSSRAEGAHGRTADQVRAFAGRTGAWARVQGKQVQSWLRTQSWARSWAQPGNVESSQMMIIAGAVLLVCGGLLLGGGLFLRAGAGSTATAATEETFAGIAWTFQETDRPLPERAVFTLSGTPAAFRINGLSISGVNLSDQPITAVDAVLKPDVQRPDLKLTVRVDKQAVGDGDAQALEVVPKGTVPPHAPFRLVFPFPAEAMGGEDGITVEEFFESYGGLLLKVRYEVAGQQKSLIQYLAPDMLSAQLEEVSAEATGG